MSHYAITKVFEGERVHKTTLKVLKEEVFLHRIKELLLSNALSFNKSNAQNLLDELRKMI